MQSERATGVGAGDGAGTGAGVGVSQSVGWLVGYDNRDTELLLRQHPLCSFHPFIHSSTRPSNFTVIKSRPSRKRESRLQFSCACAVITAPWKISIFISISISLDQGELHPPSPRPPSV